MKSTSGYYASYIAKDGSVQKISVTYSQQHKSFEQIKKVFARLLNDDLTPRKDDKDKNVCSLVEISKLTIIGYYD